MRQKEFEDKYLKNQKISIITDNSQEVLPNAVYFDLAHGRYLDDVIKAKVAAIVTNQKIAATEDIEIMYHPYPAKMMARFYAKYYEKMLDQIKIIAITGTNGKTTSTMLLYKYLRYIKVDVICVSSLGNYINDTYYETANTTDRLHILYHLIKLAKFTEGYMIIETSSQAIRQGRLWRLPLNGILITNITSDHLDFHVTNDDYCFSKLLITQNLVDDGFIITSGDATSYSHPRYLELIKTVSFHDVYTFGKSECDFTLSIIDDQHITINNFALTTDFRASYNKKNIAGVYSLINLLQLPISPFVDFIKHPPTISGRLNIHDLAKRQVVIDYAHTSAGVADTLKYLKTLSKGKVLLVIGCGGNRDRTKRSVIAKLACQFSDFAVFTEDNNRSESFTSIINDMCCDLQESNYEVIPSRFEAIKTVIKLSKEGDVVAILGKGVEKTKVVNKEMTDFEMVSMILKGEYGD